MTSSTKSFGRRVSAPPADADRRGTMRGDLYDFLSAFAGGFVFFSVLLL